MSRNYFNLDEVEIDNLLMVNLFPHKKERLNFSKRGHFEDILMPEIIKRDCEKEFIANLLKVFKTRREACIGPKSSSPELDYYYALVFTPPRPIHLKLAVLITIDSLE